MEFNQYVDIPWECGARTRESADCWGLVLLVLDEQFGLVVEHMSGVVVSDPDDVAVVMDESRVLDGWSPTLSPRAGDICMMFVASNECPEGRPEHVGIMVDGSNLLHSFSRDGGVSAIHSIATIKRIFKRLEFFTYAAD